MGWKVLISAPGFEQTPEALDVLREAGCELVPSKYSGTELDHELMGDELEKLLAGVDATIVASALVSREVIERSPSLKAIVRRGLGYDNIDVDAARAHNILVATPAGTTTEVVADHAWALLLAAARRIVEGHACVVEGRWEPYSGTALAGKTLGVIGLGKVGKVVARRASAFSMKAIAYSRSRDDAFARETGVRYVDLPELLANSDFISVNAALTEETRHLIDAVAIARMKPSAIVVNTARGALIDETALASALRDGRLRAAAVDVFEEEPPKTSSLKALRNVVMTPHTGGIAPETRVVSNVAAATTIANYMRGTLPVADQIVVAPA